MELAAEKKRLALELEELPGEYYNINPWHRQEQEIGMCSGALLFFELWEYFLSLPKYTFLGS